MGDNPVVNKDESFFALSVIRFDLFKIIKQNYVENKTRT